MNDNHDFHADRRNSHLLLALRDLNVGANGRWFMLALVAIAIAAGLLKFAVVLAIIIGLSVILEQLTAPWRAVAAYIVYAWAAVMAVVLLVLV